VNYSIIDLIKDLAMKNIILLLLTIIFLSCGTDQGEGKTYTYTVINKSGKTIEIRSYISYLPKVTPVITNIENGQEITKTFEDGLPPSGYSFKSFFGENPNKDSLVVVYNNEKINFFGNDCSNIRNPLNNCFYRDEEETFIFSQEDYQNATPCDGDCE
jgi:hypothetical protein